MNEFITSDIVADWEAQFALAGLLTCDYFKKYREGYYAAREAGCLNRYRNYITLLENLNDIHDYNEKPRSPTPRDSAMRQKTGETAKQYSPRSSYIAHTFEEFM